MGGFTSGEGGGLIPRIVFLLADTWAYIQGLIKEGQVEYTHFASILNQLD